MKRSLLLLLILLAGTLHIHSETKDNHLVTAFGKADITWNPLHSSAATEAQIYTAIYEGLVSYHPLTLEPVPAVASSWEISDDRLVYTFHLRENARYWNGDRVTAGHFRDTWLKLIHPDEQAEYSFLLDVVKNAKGYRNGAVTDAAEVGIEAVSDTELKVTLNSPAGHFLKILAHHSFTPVHPDLLNIEDWKSRDSIISNGPFTITEKTSDKIELVKNSEYWDVEKVETEKLTIILSDDYEDLTRRFNNREIHWTTNFRYDLLDRPQKTFILNPQFATSYFFFNCRETPWSNPKVRKALNLLIDWDSVRNEELLYLPATTIVPEIGGYPEVESIESQDVEAAMALLEEAGYPKGEGLPNPRIIILPAQEHRQFAGAMKSAWDENLGISTEISEIPFGSYYAALERDDYTLGTMSWIGDYPDPLTFLQMWVSDSNLNKGKYVNTEYDNMIQSAIAAQGIERYEQLAKAEALILEESGIIPYKHEPAMNAVHIDTLQYWMFNPLDIHPFKYLRYDLPPLIPNTVMNRKDSSLPAAVFRRSN